jgi:hypothetical protein
MTRYNTPKIVILTPGGGCSVGGNNCLDYCRPGAMDVRRKTQISQRCLNC